jgi:hypothetical protein
MYEKIDAIKYSPIYQELLKHENSVTRYALRLKQEKKISDDDYFREIEVAGKIVADVTEHMKDVFSRYYEGTTDEDKKEWVYSNIRAAHNKLDALYPAIDQLESRQVSANKKNTLIMFGAGAIVIFILTAFFVPALRIPAHILILLAIVVSCFFKTNAWFAYGLQSANPNVPAYAVTIYEEEAKRNRENAMGCSVVFGILGAIVFLVGLFLGWGQNWWYELVGLGILVITLVLG